MRIRQQLSVAVLAVIAVISMSGVASAAPARPQASASYTLSGAYTLSRDLTTCRKFKTCGTSPMPIKVIYTGLGWTISNYVDGVWNDPIDLTWNPSLKAWQAEGYEGVSFCANGKHVPTQVTITLKGSDIASGIARQLNGTYKAVQLLNACTDNKGNLAVWTVGTGPWPDTTGPPAADQYYGYPYPDAPQCTAGPEICDADVWGFYQGQCTSWVAYRLNELNGIKFTDFYDAPPGWPTTVPFWGRASTWLGAAESAGIAYSHTPVVGSVAWWPDSSSHRGGHVAYVEQVISRTEIVISEMNYDNGNGFRVVTITPSKTDGDLWPAYFIHFPGS